LETSHAEGFREHRLPVAAEISLYYREYGTDSDATPVVCLPGYWRTSRDFEELAAYLAPKRRVITVDLRGRGKSGRAPDPADYHFDRMVEDVLKLLDATRVSQAVFVGLALGAQISMELAVTSPARVAGIVLNDSAPESNPSAGTRMKQFAGADELTFEQALERVRAQYGPDCPRLTEADFKRLVHRGYRQIESGACVRDFDQASNRELARMKDERPTFWREFKAIQGVPIGILRGANSDYLTEEIAARMLAENPSARLYTIPDVGHPAMLWEPESFAAVDEVLALVDGRA